MSEHKQQVSFDTEEKGRQAGRDDADDEQARPDWWEFVFQPHHLRSMAKYCPLIAAILAPLATLLDIPALSVSRMTPTDRSSSSATLVRPEWHCPIRPYGLSRALGSRTGAQRPRELTPHLAVLGQKKTMGHTRHPLVPGIMDRKDHRGSDQFGDIWHLYAKRRRILIL